MTTTIGPVTAIPTQTTKGGYPTTAPTASNLRVPGGRTTTSVHFVVFPRFD
jgi:hypothetical protein